MNLTKNSLEILKSYRSKQNIQSVADIFNITYSVIRNNYFKYFWRKGYLRRISKGCYVISHQGHNKIIQAEKLLEIDDIIKEEAQKGTSNEDIRKIILNRYNQQIIFSTVYGKICRLRKKYGFVDRRCQIAKIPPQFSPELEIGRASC